MVQKSTFQKLAKYCDKRPCFVERVEPNGNGGWKRITERAFFHGWTYEVDAFDKDTITGSTEGIVEYEDGAVTCVCPLEIQFVDGGSFDQFKWPELPNDEDDDA